MACGRGFDSPRFHQYQGPRVISGLFFRPVRQIARKYANRRPVYALYAPPDHTNGKQYPSLRGAGAGPALGVVLRIARNPAIEVQLRAGGVPYRRVAELIGLVHAAELTRIGFVTESAAPGP